MANSPRRVYWDACAWIALIQREVIRGPDGKVVEDRATMCRTVIAGAAAGTIEIATCSLSLVEVCRNPNIKSDKPDRIADFFENDYVLLVNLDKNVGTRARQLMMAGFSGLKPPDSCHLAAAAVANAEELHTFDRRLLALDGQVDKADGTRLKICKPGPSGPVPPLLQLVAGG